ncbi:uncharacterized protein L201_008004 [Kwoniella dendrophila CBS 6074]|uniref:Uncharacterized protein n=1 Tax=Kwoniella dendrophila CBS 6074 TaxID=1295534 RepID=A0AAX4K643_9TREE
MSGWDRIDHCEQSTDNNSSIERWKRNIIPENHEIPNTDVSRSTLNTSFPLASRQLKSPFQEKIPGWSNGFPSSSTWHTPSSSTSFNNLPSKPISEFCTIPSTSTLRYPLPVRQLPPHMSEPPVGSSVQLPEESDISPHIHPYFPHDPTKPQMMIRSNDNIGYYLSIQSVKGLSSQLSHRVQPTIKSGKYDVQTIKWEKADSNSVTLILTTLLQPERFTDSTTPTNPLMLIKFLPESIKVADDYGISRFFNSFTSILIKLNSSSLVMYTAFALKNDLQSCKKYSRLTINSEYLDQPIPMNLSNILKSYKPDYLKKLENLHEEWNLKYNLLYKSFCSDLNGVNIKLDGFGSRCKKRFSRGCQGFILSKGNFKLLRSIASDSASSIARQYGYTSMNGKIEESIHESIGCETCSHRFINAFDAVMRSVFENASQSI